MNKRAVTAMLGLLLLVFAGFMAVPLLMALRENPGSDEVKGLGVGVLACLAVGGAMFGLFRGHLKGSSVGEREGIAITTLGWIVLTAFGAIPFCVTHGIGFTDAYFEVMSGLTTTGSTILTAEQIDAGVGRWLMFWRSLTHWIGGMGIILLTVAILPLLGSGGYQLFRAEVPGPTKDRLKPRIIETAKTLWMIYVGLSAAETGLLWICGMDLYDALCHTFGTMATGGFSTHSQSLGYFSQAFGPARGLAIEVIVDVFMFLAGCNFVLLYRCASGRSLKPLWQSSEFRTYLFFTLGAMVLMTWMLAAQTPTPAAQMIAATEGGEAKGYSVTTALRAAGFNTISIMTTTGFGTEDFDVWPAGCRFLLLILMVAGGCAGSTGGGIKQLRVILLAKFAWRELLRIIRPRAVILVKHDGQPVEREVLASLLGFFVLYAGVLCAGTLALTIILGVEQTPITGSYQPYGTLVTSFTACLSALSNIGPGLAGVGPMRYFGELPDLAKWILSLMMLMGRLEIFTVLALLAPTTWRK